MCKDKRQFQRCVKSGFLTTLIPNKTKQRLLCMVYLFFIYYYYLFNIKTLKSIFKITVKYFKTCKVVRILYFSLNEA